MNGPGESESLLPVARNTSNSMLFKSVKAKLCISSKPARLILLWNLAILIGYKTVYSFDGFMQVSYFKDIPTTVNVVLSVITLVSPIVGLTTDIKLSRYKAVLCSSYVTLIEIMIYLFVLALNIVLSQMEQRIGAKISFYLLLLLVVIMVISFIVFFITAFQFGMDQMHDSSTEDLIVYIHWYVTIYYACLFISELQWNLILYEDRNFRYFGKIRIYGTGLLLSALITVFILLILSLCAVQHKKVWFWLEPPGTNPYKLVYKVVKFACKNRVPLRRSAFTYSEDDPPSRLDLGKQKYGGPFTTRQVEDVKAFLGILLILVSVGPAFYLQTVIHSMLPAFARHGNYYIIYAANRTHQVHIEGIARHIFISNGLLSPLLVVICIPLYLRFIRPRVLYHIPGILKRIGIGISLMILSLICAFIMDFIVHARHTENANCMFNGYGVFFRDYKKISLDNSTGLQDVTEPLYLNVYFLTSQHIVYSIINMLMDVAVLEFICSQSPYSMKGLVFGLSLSVKSLFQVLAILSIIPFGRIWNIQSLSCGSGFYLMNIVIALLEMVLFFCVGKKYKYREMNEPANEYRYAEEYYSRHPVVIN